MTALGEEMLVVSLSQHEGRNTRARLVASGALVPDGGPAADLPLVARVLYRHIRDYSG